MVLGLWGVGYLRDHVLEGLHDLRALSFLEVGEAAGDDDDSRQHDTQIQLQRWRQTEEEERKMRLSYLMQKVIR